MIQDDLQLFLFFYYEKFLRQTSGIISQHKLLSWPAFFHNNTPLVFVASFGYIYIDSSTMADEEETQALVCDNGMSQ